jgi:hypothetical protein
MKIVAQGLSLSEEDLELLGGSKIIETMMKNRLLVEFDESPDIDSLNFANSNGFYHIKSLGSKLFQFWFYDRRDYDVFYENIIAYKLSVTDDSDK